MKYGSDDSQIVESKLRKFDINRSRLDLSDDEIAAAKLDDGKDISTIAKASLYADRNAQAASLPRPAIDIAKAVAIGTLSAEKAKER